ncbi:MAG TPA: T9SS type A sorting domain-containing protein [Fluviicola sp.]|nr:T9SS type A sorting domain-containing protein [Fluviicola sp.]
MKIFSLIATTVALALSTPLSAQVSVFGDPNFDQSVTQVEIDNAGPVFSQQTVLFPSTQTFLFNGTSQKEIRATNRIKIEPGFKSGTYSGAGKMKLTVAPSPFDVAVMNYVDGVEHVLGYQKLELGVQLPTDINTKVSNFVNGLTTNILNPYMEWDLRVYAIFTHPNEAEPIIIDGYYSKEFTSWMVDPLPEPDSGPVYQSEEYNALGGWNEDVTDYPFRVRFSPTQSGVWKAKIVIATEDGAVEVSTPDFEFNVFGTSNHGFVDVSANNRYLELDGESFYPVGCNISWPETNEYHDPELRALIPAGEDFWTVQCRPRVYEKYRGVISDLADNGANYLRLIMSPTGTDIEHEKLGDYTGRLHMADELDQIVELAEEKGIFLHWNFNIHFRFENCDSEHWRPWNWNVTSSNGVPFCYPAEISGVEDPIDYFTNAEAKKYHKQRLRYILSRWGYSTSIGAFELFSEISNVGSQAPASSKYSTGSNWTYFRDWQVEMGNYIKSTYLGKQHLLTCSYSGSKLLGSEGYENGAGMADDDNTFNYPCFDIMTCNVYDFNNAEGAHFFKENISENMLNGQTPFSYVKNFNPGESNPIIKPLLFAECEPIDNQCDDFKIELKRSLWQSMFSGLAGGFSWVNWYYPETYSTYGKMTSFISQFDLGEELYHPGASLFGIPAGESYSNWYYESDYTNTMGLDGEDKADLIFLRSGDGNSAIGVITNKTINPYSIGDACIAVDWVNYHTPSTVSISNDSGDEHLKLKGMNWGEYRIDYYYANDPLTEIHHSTAYGPIIPIEVDFVSTDPTTAFILFKAYKLSGSRMDSTAIIIDPETINTVMNRNKTPEVSVFQVYPNPATSEVFVETPSNNSENIVIIESLDGRVSKKLSFSENRMSISISDLKPATYVVKCYAGENLVGLQKIVKL